MTNRFLEFGKLQPGISGEHACSTLTVGNRKLRMVLDQLEEFEAYRQLDQFFAREGQLLELMEVLGIDEEDVLEEFLRLGFTPRTAPAIEMVPVVFVAWASGEVTEDECAAAVSAIHDSELAEFPKTWACVQTWLDVHPDQSLWNLWCRYMRCRLDALSDSRQASLRARLKRHGHLVARASGGWLGIGSICHEEQVVLNAIDSVFLDAPVQEVNLDMLMW